MMTTAIESTIITGAPLSQARAAMILLHGRGADAASILQLTSWLDTDGFALLAPRATAPQATAPQATAPQATAPQATAPQAPGRAWYPERFLAPLERNEPWLTLALDKVQAEFDRLSKAGIPPSQTILLGFSQGACLALEYAARHARRYGAVVGLSGGLIGPDDLLRSDKGSLAGTPVFLGCSDVDFHIPRHRVEHAALHLASLGAEVDLQLYPGMDHTVNEDELCRVQELMNTLRRSA
jgi:predicted esterase